MRNYRDFWYRPDYGYILYEKEENKLIESYKHVEGAVCFSRVFHTLDRYHTQTIFEGIYTLKCRKNFVAHSGNYCSMSRKDVRRTINVIRKNFDTKVELSETNDNYIFKFHVIGTSVKHKFILTFSRVFFEFPYNEFIKDVFRLKELGKLGDINITHTNFLTLFHLISITYRGAVGGGHTLFDCPETNITYKILLDAFKEGRDRVQAIYPGNYDYYRKVRKLDSAYFDWDINFDKRVNNYSKNFQILKKLKANEHKENIRRRKRENV